MKDYEKKYKQIVSSPPSRKYSTANEEGWAIKKYTRLKDEDVRYGSVVYYPDEFSRISFPKHLS